MARGRRLSLPNLLEQGMTPVLIVDDDERTSFVSEGLIQLTGWDRDTYENLRYRRGAPVGPAPRDILGCALAPPAECWKGRFMDESAVIPHRDGRVLNLHVQFIPLLQPDHSICSIMVSARAADPAAAEPSVPPPGRSLYAEIQAMRLDLRKRFRKDSFFGRSPAIRKALRQAELAARSSHSFMITGPEGSGRRHLARLIHHAGEHAEESLAMIDCHLLTVTALLATWRQLIHVADHHSRTNHQIPGLLVLAGLEHMPREAQTALFQTASGEKRGIRIAATSVDTIQSLSSRNLLIPELAEMLSTLEISLPSLHDREDDVLLISESLLQELRRDQGTIPEKLSSELRQEFLEYRWPGNVRELRTVITTAATGSRTSELRTADLPMQFRIGQDAQRYPVARMSEVISLEEVVQQMERELITSMLRECRGNKAEVARRLSLTRPKLYRLMASLGMNPDDDTPRTTS
ncbi:MAG: sigma 54-interacting transcriptional regulator [Planctomyces sp.]